MAAFEHEGVRLTYTDTGPGSDPGAPLVLQHGLGGDATQPAAHAPPGRRIVTLECRGHGGSELGPEAALGFETYADDLDALLEQLGIAHAVVGGISMGAGVALTLARRHPSRVGGLVLVRPAWVDRRWPVNLHVFAEIAALLRKLGPRAGQAAFVAGSPARRRLAAISPATARSLDAQFDRPRAVERAAVLERLPGDRPLAPGDRADALAMPALVIAAPRDGVHPLGTAVALHRRLAHARLREVPAKDLGEARHRRAVADAIDAFLAELPTGIAS